MRSKIFSFVGNFRVSVQQCMLHKHFGVQEKVRKIEENSLNPKPPITPTEENYEEKAKVDKTNYPRDKGGVDKEEKG